MRKHPKLSYKQPIGRPKKNNVVFYKRCSVNEKKLLQEYFDKIKEKL